MHYSMGSKLRRQPRQQTMPRWPTDKSLPRNADLRTCLSESYAWRTRGSHEPSSNKPIKILNHLMKLCSLPFHHLPSPTQFTLQLGSFSLFLLSEEGVYAETLETIFLLSLSSPVLANFLPWSGHLLRVFFWVPVIFHPSQSNDKVSNSGSNVFFESLHFANGARHELTCTLGRCQTELDIAK